MYRLGIKNESSVAEREEHKLKAIAARHGGSRGLPLNCSEPFHEISLAENEVTVEAVLSLS